MIWSVKVRKVNKVPATKVYIKLMKTVSAGAFDHIT